MNEYERRKLEVVQNHINLVRVVHDLKQSALIEHFGYTAVIGIGPPPASAIVPGVTQSVNIPIQADAYFVLQYISTAVIKPNSPFYCTDSGNILLEITDTGSGEVLFSAPSLAAILSGTTTRPQTGIPMLLPIPRVLEPNTTVKIDATQLGSNAAENQPPLAFFLSLIGSRIARY